MNVKTIHVSLQKINLLKLCFKRSENTLIDFIYAKYMYILYTCEQIANIYVKANV